MYYKVIEFPSPLKGLEIAKGVLNSWPHKSSFFKIESSSDLDKYETRLLEWNWNESLTKSEEPVGKVEKLDLYIKGIFAKKGLVTVLDLGNSYNKIAFLSYGTSTTPPIEDESKEMNKFQEILKKNLPVERYALAVRIA